jgi:hypothetical protein
VNSCKSVSALALGKDSDRGDKGVSVEEETTDRQRKKTWMTYTSST